MGGKVMSDKFEGIPSDDDTMVLVKIPMQFDGLDCIFQVWVWDGIKGVRLIFVNEEVADLDDVCVRATPGP
jgi:hypothetical protein